MAERSADETGSPRRRAALGAALPSLLAVGIALAVCFLAIAWAKGSLDVAARAYAQMLWGGLGDWPRLLDGAPSTALTRPLGESATKATLLALTGLSVAVAYTAGLFNIGAQGQLVVGAIAAATVGSALPLPGAVHPLVAVLAAAIVGGLYGLIPAVLKVWRGVHEVISTIMLNWVAVSLVEGWLVVGPLAARSRGGHSRAGTEEVLATAELPRLLGDASRLHAGALIGLFAIVAVHLWLKRSHHGFELRVTGLAPDAGLAAGIPTRRRVLQSMAVAGALAGVAGAVLILGTEHKYPAQLVGNYGFDGIAIALIGGAHPVGVGLAAAFFGALRAGGTRMQLLDVHKSFPELIQGLALLLVAARAVFEAWLRPRARARSSTQSTLAGETPLSTPSEGDPP